MTDTTLPQLSDDAVRILKFLAHVDEKSSLDIFTRTNIASGKIHPILRELEKAKWVQNRWNHEDPHIDGQARYRLYSITDLGRDNADLYPKPKPRQTLLEWFGFKPQAPQPRL